MMISCIALLILPFPIISAVYSWRCFIKFPKRWRLSLFFFVYAVFVFAYIIKPAYSTDLIRYFEILNSVKNLSLRESIELMDDGLLVENFLFWIVSKTGNFNLLPAITTSVVYGTCGYLVMDYMNSENREKDAWKILLFLVAHFPFFSITNNIRNIFAFALITLAVYRDLYHKKRNWITYALYIIPCFIHKTGAILLFIRFLVFMLKKALILSISIIVLLPTIINVMYRNVNLFKIGGSVGKIIRRIIISAYHYLTGDTVYGERVRSSMGQNLIRLEVLFILVLIAILSFLYYKNQKEDLNIFCFLTCVFGLACNVFEAPVYWRFALIAILTSVPALSWAIQQKNGKNLLLRPILSMLPFLAIVRFLLDVGYTHSRMDIGSFLYGMMFNNAYTIMWKLLYTLMH